MPNQQCMPTHWPSSYFVRLNVLLSTTKWHVKLGHDMLYLQNIRAVQRLMPNASFNTLCSAPGLL